MNIRGTNLINGNWRTTAEKEKIVEIVFRNSKATTKVHWSGNGDQIIVEESERYCGIT